jgi:F-type H+-transporting ATPase subunit b
MEPLAIAGHSSRLITAFSAEAAENTGLSINLFWVIASAATFLLFLAIIWPVVFKPLIATLEQRRVRIEQGLKDADSARRDREAAADQRQAILAEARREANEVMARSQRVADETREQGLVETRAEIERLRERAVADIDSERLRALADVRTQVADLALQAAGKVVGETMNDQRERRLVDEFLTQVTAGQPSGSQRN